MPIADTNPTTFPHSRARTLLPMVAVYILSLVNPVLADGPGQSAFDPPAPHTHPAGQDWIMKGGHRNTAGEWCCGEGDCFMIPAEQVTTTGDGYLIFGAERIPYTEAQPSIDGAFWRCKRPDGSRRCFFAPPPST